MLVHECYSYIKIGLAIRLLRNVAETDTKFLVTKTMSSLEEELQTGSFEVTLTQMKSRSYGAIRDMVNELETVSSPIEKKLANKIQREFSTIESIVFPEASIKKIYVLPNRRFNTEYLLNEPQKLLKAGAFDKLDEIAKTDITSACKCLLFGEATAAAFHILRATESVLKSYYFHHRRRNRLPKPMWGNMLDQLRSKTRNKPPAALLNSLDLIRSAYRNPTQHPEARYNIDSVQDLFGVCLDVIGKMADEI